VKAMKDKKKIIVEDLIISNVCQSVCVFELA
jgi:hypothetical protein